MVITKAEQKLVWLLRLWIFVFLTTGIALFFYGSEALSLLNQLSHQINPWLPPLQDALEEKFWLVFMMSLQMTLVFLCYWGQKDIRHNRAVVSAILASKFTSTFLFFLFFMTHKRSGAYFIGMCVDGFLFIVTYYFFTKAKQSTPVNS